MARIPTGRKPRIQRKPGRPIVPKNERQIFEFLRADTFRRFNNKSFNVIGGEINRLEKIAFKWSEDSFNGKKIKAKLEVLGLILNERKTRGES